MSTAIYQQSARLVKDNNLNWDQISNLLAPVGFENRRAAYKTLQQIAGHSPQTRLALANGLPSLFMALANTANSNRVLVSFERFIQNSGDPQTILEYLAANPRGFEILATVFAGSQFLTEIILRNPQYFEQLTDLKQLAQTKTLGRLQQESLALVNQFIKQSTPGDDVTPILDDLRLCQRHELLRIGTCDLLGLLDLPTVTLQLSHLTDSLAGACLALAAWQTQTNPQDFAIIGMGKLGGEEINYSSDIDLIFLAYDNPNQYWKMSQALIDALDRSTNEGFLYRVDMRLRPWGKSGALVSSVEGHIGYLQKHANLWERQALLKARAIAGHSATGQDFLTQAKPIIFDTHGEPLRAEIHKLKQRIEAQLKKRGRQWGEVKLGQGSIRDIEFVTQYLQLDHGPGNPRQNLVTPTTLKALSALYNADILPQDEYRVLTDGYIFLRTVEHHLQLMHYRQTHTLPTDPQALNSLALRLGFWGEEAGKNFIDRYQQHSAVIRAVYQRHLGDDHAKTSHPRAAQPDVLPLLVRMPPAYVASFSDADIEHHARLMEELSRTNLIKVEARPVNNDLWQVTIVGFDYIGALSLICGLLFVYGFDIVDGMVFSYGPPPTEESKSPKFNWRRRKRPPIKPAYTLPERKIVDVFTVRPIDPNRSIENPQAFWQQYDDDVTALTQRLHQGEQHEAQGELAKRVAVALPQTNTAPTQLLPIDIIIDNNTSDRHTVLKIDAPDTFGFLYEFTNALALTGINIRRMTVASDGYQVQDTLYVTDSQRKKITSPEKQRELRAATALIKHFTHLLPSSPNPEAALLHFREFVGQLFTHPDWPDELISIEQPEVLNTLARLLGVSDFLWNDFLRMQHTNLFPVVRDVNALSERTPKSDLREELAIALHTAPKGQGRHAALNAFKDREMFRIDMREIQGHTSFSQFSEELTDLAEIVVEGAFYLVSEELRNQYGIPKMDGGGTSPMSICALGKCGGRELGFASDIELMFIFKGNGRTTGPRVITTSEYYTKLVQEVNRTIQTRNEGIFELDLRLRPYGNAGSMAVSLEAFESYFGPDGEAWPYERQALVRLRPISGDLKFGQQLVRLRDQLIYTREPFDFAAMRAMRERQLRHLVTAGSIHVKFSPGGLVDAEYLVQGLQISYGHLDPSFRTPSTRKAMQALAAANYIPAEDYPRLLEAYNFLRELINALRMVRGNAKDLTVPLPNDEEFAFLARRLNYGSDLNRLQDDLTRHMGVVQELSEKLLIDN